MKNKASLRPLGDITQDLEPLLLEMVDEHAMQHGEVLGLIHAWLMIHSPESREVYVEDDSSPEFYYGPSK